MYPGYIQAFATNRTELPEWSRTEDGIIFDNVWSGADQTFVSVPYIFRDGISRSKFRFMVTTPNPANEVDVTVKGSMDGYNWFIIGSFAANPDPGTVFNYFNLSSNNPVIMLQITASVPVIPGYFSIRVLGSHG